MVGRGGETHNRPGDGCDGAGRVWTSPRRLRINRFAVLKRRRRKGLCAATTRGPDEGRRSPDVHGRAAVEAAHERCRGRQRLGLEDENARHGGLLSQGHHSTSGRERLPRRRHAAFTRQASPPALVAWVLAIRAMRDTLGDVGSAPVAEAVTRRGARRARGRRARRFSTREVRSRRTAATHCAPPVFGVRR